MKTRIYKPLRQFAGAVLVLGLSLQPGFSATPETEESIEHLLAFIENSDCQFIRNGTTHGSQEAAAHIRQKYGSIHRKVQTPEQFIEFAASRSSITGKPYYVQCDKEPRQLSGDWLREELLRSRATAATSN